MKHSGSERKNNKNTRIALFEMPLDIGIGNEDLADYLVSDHFLLSYLNPYAYSIVKSDPDYASNLGRFDLVVCDGIGIQAAVEAVFNLTTPVISLDYSGIGHEYLQLGAERKMHLCLVGGETQIVDTAAAKIRNDFPGYVTISTFNGYGESPAEARQFILESRPGLVLAGLGMGRQESFLLELADSGWRGIGICVGGFFDKLAKPELDYPRWTEKANLRFLGRMIREPLRMSKRYFIDYQPFIGLYLKHKLGLGRTTKP